MIYFQSSQSYTQCRTQYPSDDPHMLISVFQAEADKEHGNRIQTLMVEVQTKT